MLDLPDLPDSLQEDQEDDYISNIADNKSSDEKAELLVVAGAKFTSQLTFETPEIDFR